jgi:hypothetical protein
MVIESQKQYDTKTSDLPSGYVGSGKLLWCVGNDPVEQKIQHQRYNEQIPLQGLPLRARRQ